MLNVISNIHYISSILSMKLSNPAKAVYFISVLHIPQLQDGILNMEDWRNPIYI
jgi:hypothetical protein